MISTAKTHTHNKIFNVLITVETNSHPRVSYTEFNVVVYTSVAPMNCTREKKFFKVFSKRDIRLMKVNTAFFRKA